RAWAVSCSRSSSFPGASSIISLTGGVGGRLMNFGTIFYRPLKLSPEKETLIYWPHRITYAGLENPTNRRANGLRALEIGAGDHVAVLVKNDHRFVETMLGALRAGATVTPTTTRAHLSTLTHIMRDSQAKILFASSDFAEEARKLAE